MRSTVGGDARRACWRRRWRSVPVALWLVALALLVLPAGAQAAGNAYVANAGFFNVSQSANVSQYAIAAGDRLSPLTPATVFAGAEPAGVAVTLDGKSVYVTDFLGYSVSQFSVDPVTGALSPKTPATVPAGAGPEAVAVTPDGKSAYVTNANDGTVSQYNVGPVSGALSPKTPASVGTARFANAVAVTPDGKSAYVTNENGGTVSQYTINPATGALSPKAPATVATGTLVFGIAVTPDGKSAYITNLDDDAVAQYSIDPVTGALSPKTPATVVAGGGPNGVAVTPDGKSAYVTNVTNVVSQYSIDPVTGTLSPKTPATIGTMGEPVGVTVGPDGKSAYVADTFSPSPGFILQYAIDPLTGELSLAGAAPTGIGPGDIAFTPLPRVHPTAISVSCSPPVFAPGDATVCRATVTDTAGSGQSTPTGTVGFTHSGSGSLYGSPCAMKGSGGSASCAVVFTSFPRGGQAITASYGGDATHSASIGRTLVAVVLPASTNGCRVFGHGRITAANGDQASFRGLAFARPPLGAEWYRDSGPANPFRLVSTSVNAVTCSPDASRASVFGTAKLNGTGSVEYRVDIQLAAWERGRDTYRIRLSNGYDSGPRQIRHGDLNIHLAHSDHRHHDANANQTQGAQPDGG